MSDQEARFRRLRDAPLDRPRSVLTAHAVRWAFIAYCGGIVTACLAVGFY